MRIVRFELQGRTGYGILEGEKISILWSTPYDGGLKNTVGETASLPAVKLLAPCEPTKIVALGLNYRDHAAEFGHPLPEEPLIFLKPPSAVIGPDDDIVYPARSRRVDYEAELAVVMGRPCRYIKAGDFRDYVLGYTCINDVTARDLQKKDGQFTRSKSFDSFAPLGPWIETEIPDPDNLAVEAYLNGENRSSGWGRWWSSSPGL
jgi:2-keto-4-pentenoate hydratase/2-oxohepta-3-ene-1,7-dioic acid hydratase in catechol pathway